MGTRAGSRDVAPIIRGAFKRAVKELEDGGRPLSTIVRENLESDFLGTLRALAGFVPKELEAKIEHKHSIKEFSDAELADIIVRGRAGIAEQAGGEEESAQFH